MSMLTRFNPFRAQTRFDPITDFDELVRGLALRPLMRDLDTAAAEMRMDVQEDDKAFLVSLDIPGANKDDIDVTVEGNQVTVQAEVKSEQTHHDSKHLYTERYAGRSFRSFVLPQDVDRERCDAQYENGVLMLTLPKKAGSQPRRLAIQ